MKLALTVDLIAGVMLLTACGGGSTSSTSSANVSRATAESTQAKPRAKRGRHRAERVAKPENAEEGVERFGSEASGAGRRAILGTEQDYLKALSERRYSSACPLLGRKAIASIKQLVVSGLRTALNCRAILSKLMTSSGTAMARQQLAGKITRIRRKGSEAFIIFRAPGARLWVFPMVDEGGRWRVDTVNSTILAPSTATLEGK
jgi:hypothetical protein